MPSDYDLAETYLPHFRRTVTEANVYSVMCAYQRLRGAPCCGSAFLENLLRNEWNFQGYIVSDCGAIKDFYAENAHAVTATPGEAAAMAVRAGTDLNCGSVYAQHLYDAVQQGLLTEEEINVSVRRLILARMKLGMFDPDSIVNYSQIPLKVLDSEQHRLLALQSARKSMVLLKNDKNILPFSKAVKKVAVIGPNADERDVLLGNYYGYPSFYSTACAGIKKKLPDAEVAYAAGCGLVEGFPLLSAIPAKVFYTAASQKQAGLKAEYFDNSSLQGLPKHKRIDANVDFTWGSKAPFPDFEDDNYSVRWTGVLAPPYPGEYTFGGEALSGFKLFIDEELVLNYPNHAHHARKIFRPVSLDTGKVYNIRVEYCLDHNEHSTMQLLWDAPNANLKNEALELAKRSDLVVLCMGLSPVLEGEEMPVDAEGFSGGDRTDIRLPEVQNRLIAEILALRKPTVLVLFGGSALAFDPAQSAPAIIQAWYPGQAGGEAVADVIFGDYNPAGRLPVTFYKSIDQISDFDDYDMQGKTYRYFEGEPLYEFGYGLSFTSFEYAVKNIPDTVKAGEAISVEVEVKNTGAADGDEVVQLYVSHPESAYRHPVRALQGFTRIHLKAGETRTVNFELQAWQITVRDEQNTAFVAPGKLLVSVGGKQPDAKSLLNKSVVEKTLQVVGEIYEVKDK
jgi:beta-glucosidase